MWESLNFTSEREEMLGRAYLAKIINVKYKISVSLKPHFGNHLNVSMIYKTFNFNESLSITQFYTLAKNRSS